VPCAPVTTPLSSPAVGVTTTVVLHKKQTEITTRDETVAERSDTRDNADIWTIIVPPITALYILKGESLDKRVTDTTKI